MFEFQHNPDVDPGELARLFARVGWRESDPDHKVEWIVASSEEWITCTLDGELVGFGRSLRLDAARKMLLDVVVDDRFDGLGVDDEIVRMLTDGPAVEDVAVYRQEDLGSIVLSEQPGDGGEYWVPDAPPEAYLG